MVTGVWSASLPFQRTLRCQPVSSVWFALSLQVLLQWRCAASLQGCYRQQKMTAVMEARKHLETGELLETGNSQKI